MSDFEQIFFDPGALSVAQAARMLARALRLNESRLRDDVVLSGAVERVDVGGTVEPNIYADTAPAGPDDVSIFDSMPMVFEFRVPKAEFDHQQRIARILYERLTESLAWRSALTRGYSLLVASFDADRGFRTFEAGTLSEGTHAHLWR